MPNERGRTVEAEAEAKELRTVGVGKYASEEARSLFRDPDEEAALHAALATCCGRMTGLYGSCYGEAVS